MCRMQDFPCVVQAARSCCGCAPCFLTPGASRFWGVIQKHLSETSLGNSIRDHLQAPGTPFPSVLSSLSEDAKKGRQGVPVCLSDVCRMPVPKRPVSRLDCKDWEGRSRYFGASSF